MVSEDNVVSDDRQLRLPGSNAANKQKQNPYQFSPEELRVIKDCNRDSFLQRCIPLGTALGVGTYFGVNAGYIRPSARFGATPKVVIAVVVGYFVGKFSYQYKCAEKLMQLPNSQIGEMLRQRRKGNFQDTLEPGLGSAGMSLAPFSVMGGSSGADQYSDVTGPTNTNDMDVTRPQYEGLDDSHRPSVDNPIFDEEMPPVQQHATSYEELRQKNRDEFQQKRISSYRSGPVAETQQNSLLPRELQDIPQDSANTSKSSFRTNKYGDTV